MGCHLLPPTIFNKLIDSKINIERILGVTKTNGMFVIHCH